MKPKTKFAALLALSAASSMPAMALTWNDTGATDNWNTTDANWDSGSMWTNGGAANFSGIGETVNLAEAGITAGTVTFSAGGYTINTNGQDTTWATLAGSSGFTKSGAGTLTLSNASTASGTVAITGGRITLGNNTALGTASVTLNGGAIERNAAGQTVTNAITVGAGGGTILGRQTVDDYTEFSGQLSGSGALTVQGLVRFSGATSSHTGNITISNASATYLRLSASEVLGNSAAVTFAGTNATLRIDSGYTETVGSLSGTGNIFVSKVGASTGGTLKFGGDNSSTSLTAGITNNDGQINLVKQGTGTFTLTPNGGSTMNSFTVSAGTLSLVNNNFGTGTFTLGDSNTGANNVQLTTTGSSLSRDIVVSANGTGTATIGSTGGTGNTAFSGTLTLNRATTLTGGSTDRTTYTGRITGNAGTLTIAGGKRTVFESTAGLNDFTGDLVVSGSGTILQIGAGTLTGENIPNGVNLTVDSGAFLKLANNANSTETINALNGAGTVRRHEGVGGLQTLVIGSAGGSGSFSGKFENGAGSLAIVKGGAGTQTITTAGQAASGGITVNGGTLKLDASAGWEAGVFGGTHAFTVNTGATLEVANAWNIRSGNTFNVNGGTIHFTLGGAEPNGNYLNNLTATNGTISGNAFRTGNNTTVTYNFSGDTGSTISASMGLVKNTPTQTVTMNVADGAAANDLTISGSIHDVTSLAGSTFAKTGAGKLVLSGSNTYTGATTVNAGTLLVTGALGNTAVTVSPGATVGGGGTIGGTLSLGINSFFDIFAAVENNDPLSVTGSVSFGSGFGIDNLTGVNWDTVADGTYTLLTGSGQDFAAAGLDNWGEGQKASIGTITGRYAYFESGSLKMVVIPEPSAMVLGALGALGLSLRRRRGNR